jgi:hypothetical protein
MDLIKSHEETGQGEKRDVAKPQLFAFLNKLEPRLTGAQVHYHEVI